ncbi:serine/threonine-protein phosphatase 1 regulatory subunit 10 isoform X1 [Dermochelys coriacea]|uniref:serine/threonine-protein phosphatase 1 regulatory subunit 10 isoform X1 n=1 Tax=Dermochelys coriacea TaxID=27794 RepID=UPI0018E89D18|nr:serine/threonine-protein phosphatase 1 regulatory subunit 10 isoform X1 [Dermochelys coriacea]XP_038227126.1 serine/threonine-protein phosphatase 1 regulatory subunit 10 isoform X1 [Dermochelys coriacea]
MGSGPIDPHELLKGLDCFLGRDGEVKNTEGVTKIFNLMKDAQKMVSRCIYLNILLQTRAQDILAKFIRVGGYKLLNTWLTSSKASSNVPLLQQILLTLQHLPLTVDHLKQNNTAKLVKQLSKSSEDEELRRLASILVSDWMGVIRSQSSAQPAERDKKKRKEESKSKAPVQEKPQEAKAEAKAEETPEKKREKPKSLRTTAPSHAKFRSTGLELETPSLVPLKKNPNAVVVSEKYNLKPMPIKRQSTSAPSGDNPPVEKKYKPLNTTPNSTKEIKVKIIPAQPMEGLGFLDALNSAPIPGIKIKKKKKVLSPTAAKSSPFEGKPAPEASAAKPSSPEPATASEPMEVDRPGTPVPAVEVPELMETASSEQNSDTKPPESAADSTQLTKKGKKKKTVSWPEESKLREYFYFELDETERVNVNKIKDFGEAAKREMLKDREAFETARRLSHDAMEEKVPWVYPKLIDLPNPLVQPGNGSREKFTQAEREKGILQEIFLSKESVPDSPHEPDPESYEPLPPKLIPLDEECTMDEAAYQEGLDPAAASQSPDGAGASKLPPVLANLMGSMGAGKSPQGPNPSSSMNVQEILTSIMGGPNNHKTEELMKQPDYSDKIKHLLGNLQTQPPGPSGVPHGLLGPGPLSNGFPPGPKNMQHFPPGGPGPMPGPHGGPGGPNMPPGPGMPGGPRMMGPPPPQRGEFWDPPDGGMRGNPHGGMRGGGPGPGPGPGPFHRGRGGEPPFRGRGGGGRSGGPPNGRGGPPNNGMGGGGGHGGGGHGGGHGGHGGGHGRGHGGHGGGHGGGGHGGGHGGGGHGGGHGGDHGRGHPGDHGRGHGGGHGGDMSSRPVCRHFMLKGSCRYENNCAFYHPGVNGPPLP